MGTKNQIFSNLSNHKVHRYIFSRDKFTKDLLKGLFPLIHEDIKIKHIKVGAENLLSPCIFAGKESYSDVVAVINNDTIVLVELYNKFELEQEIKSMVYGCKIYGNQVLIGKKYKTKKRVIIINEYDFRHHIELKPYEEYFRDKHVRVVNISLDKVSKLEYTNSEFENKGLDWLNMYLAESYEEMYEIAKERKIMSEAIEMVRSFLNDPIVRGAMTNEEIEHQQDLEDTRELSLKQGIEQGKIAGIKENKIEIAKNMIKLGENEEKISLYTKLPIETIKSLKNN